MLNLANFPALNVYNLCCSYKQIFSQFFSALGKVPITGLTVKSEKNRLT